MLDRRPDTIQPIRLNVRSQLAEEDSREKIKIEKLMGQSGNYVLIVLRFQNTRGSWSYRRFNALFAALFATEFSASKYKNSSQKIIEATHKIWSVVHTYIEHVETCFTAVLWTFTGAAIFGKSPMSSKLGPRSSSNYHSYLCLEVVHPFAQVVHLQWLQFVLRSI